jgi:hypothetical protein
MIQVSDVALGPLVVFIEVLYIIKESVYGLGIKQDHKRDYFENPCGFVLGSRYTSM